MFQRINYFSAITDNVYEDLRVFTDVFTHLQKDYVEETENRTLIYGAIDGMLNTLDPHSSFMRPEVYREMQMETKGKFEGLGDGDQGKIRGTRHCH
jgi:carboxyl-terminal processing protease